MSRLSGERDVSQLKPFAGTPGRDATRDRPAPFDVARAYYDERRRIAADAPLLRQLIAAVDWTNDLTPPQWAQWYGVALGFQPDLVVELGRGRGNSTALFCQAIATLGRGRVVSLCNTGDWATVTAPRVSKVVGRRWFDPLEARITDILTADYADILGDHRRVLLLWDAHGFEIAEVVLGEILPRLLDRTHLVVMHDITDNRYAHASRSYEGQPLWKGSEWQQRTGCWGARVNIGWMHAIQDQVIAIADFSARNDLPVESADHELAQFFAAPSPRADEMRAVLGDEFFSTVAHWAFFTLTGKTGPFEFPGVAGRRVFAHRGAVVVDGLRQFPATVVTAAQAWTYASAWRWRTIDALPSGADAWLRIRVHVQEGSVGVGLVGSNGKDFTVRRALAPTRESIDVLLPVTDLANPGQLVIQTWAVPVAARVRVDELSIVW
jgi:hypothetical protein